jgi:hypothetical protein
VSLTSPVSPMRPPTTLVGGARALPSKVFLGLFAVLKSSIVLVYAYKYVFVAFY